MCAGESSPESLFPSNEWWCVRTSTFVSAFEPRSMDRADLWYVATDGLLALSPLRLGVRKADTFFRNWVVRTYKGSGIREEPTD